MKRKPWILYVGMATAAACVAGTSRAQTTATPGPVTLTVAEQADRGLSESLRREANAAAARAVAWLKARQQADGHWSNPAHPALTGFPVWALSLAGNRTAPEVRKGVDFLLGCARENGAIYREPEAGSKTGGLSNYNTAICMVGLHFSGDPRATPVVLKARTFIAGAQHLGGDIYRGGMGYDAASGRAYADLSNSYIGYEAMRLTQSVEDQRPEGQAPANLNWDAAREFIQHTQNDPDVNPQPWASDDPNEKGGFAYHPEQTRSGTYTNEQGVVKFRSMKGMSYAGLLSYIYADVQKTDPRVQATVRWIVHHGGLEGNRPSPSADPRDTQEEKEGLYYLYNVMAKGMAAYGQDVFRPENKPAFNWRVQLIERLLSLQKTDPDSGQGYWVNEVGRYWESDPVLVTSYALIALQVALGETPP